MGEGVNNGKSLFTHNWTEPVRVGKGTKEKKGKMKQGMEGHTCHLSTLEEEAGL